MHLKFCLVLLVNQSFGFVNAIEVFSAPKDFILDDLSQFAAKRAVAASAPNYQNGGASREIAPENVYMTATAVEIRKITQFIQDLTSHGIFPVGSVGVRPLVRLHFCDIVQ
ncbi:hypothetical protein NC652_010015 [Populus alba x Populus x berolinensis]|nr:hypothetical protein NC652_010015 [Populus alba x Populus x berolinensis]